MVHFELRIGCSRRRLTSGSPRAPMREPTLMAGRELLGAALGPYIVRELIREGGYGAVYRAEEPALERDVVVKVLHERRNDSDSRERFLREGKLAAQLDHPYAAHVYA